MPVYGLTDDLIFPPPHLAQNGLLAIGGDLSPSRLLLAYRMGIFPWYSEEEPILWWSPNPRFVLFPHEIKVSKSMKQVFRKGLFTITLDQDFEKVIATCQQIKRDNQFGTWITPEMMNAYCLLYEQGWAHSVEVWNKTGDLVGGLYGVALGKCFFGESMFAKQSNASKAGFITLVQQLQKWDFQLIDCQTHTKHLASLGARSIHRYHFLQLLNKCLKHPNKKGKWHLEMND